MRREAEEGDDRATEEAYLGSYLMGLVAVGGAAELEGLWTEDKRDRAGD